MTASVPLASGKSLFRVLVSFSDGTYVVRGIIADDWVMALAKAQRLYPQAESYSI